jgi:hypothetical protein
MYYKLLHSFHFNVTLILMAMRCITGWNGTMGPQRWNGLARMHQAKQSLLIKHVPKKGTYFITCPTKDATSGRVTTSSQYADVVYSTIYADLGVDYLNDSPSLPSAETDIQIKKYDACIYFNCSDFG